VYLKLDPGVMAGYMSLVMLPWSIKILYGLISDNVTLFGTKRKSYVILMGLIESISLLTIFTFNVKNGFAVTCLLACTSLCLAFVNVVVDAIMCIQARKDPVNGSQDLMSIAWFSQGIGGITGCVVGGYLTEYCDPKWTYLIMSIMGFIIAINGMFLTQECEEAENLEPEAA
jgi:MFS family permease